MEPQARPPSTVRTAAVLPGPRYPRNPRFPLQRFTWRGHFPRNLAPDFLQYTCEQPADFAKATTAKERAEGQKQ
jgi:hypothetical protein